jgi:tetratricopeptide (TPR) repeat protein
MWNELKCDLNKIQGFQFDNKNSLIRQLDDIIFSENKNTNERLLTEEIKERVNWLHLFSNKKSKKIIFIAIVSIITLTIVTIGINISHMPPTISSNKPNATNDVNTMFNKAISSYNIGRYSDALSSLDKVLQIEPNNVTAIFLKGNSSYRNGNYQDAISSFDKVLENKPNNTDAMFYKALSSYNLQRYNEAILQLNRLLAENPTNMDALLYKGLSLYNLKQYNQSSAYYDKILEIDPHNINATKEKEKIQGIKKNQSNNV